jgi:hypothetical protein
MIKAWNLRTIRLPPPVMAEMGEPNVAAAVSAIIIAYQTSKDLMQSIRLLENHYGKHRSTAEKERILLIALNAGENDIANRYSTIYGELGEVFRRANSKSSSHKCYLRFD